MAEPDDASAGGADRATLVRAGRPLHIELSWSDGLGGEPVDLDIGCFYWATDGSRGAVQSVNGAGPETGDRAAAGPDGRGLITLSSDRTGGGPEGERLTILRPGRLSFVVVYASIYQGAADFRDLGARIAVRSGREPLLDIALSSPAPGLDWCAVLVLGTAESRLHLVREERYFRSAFHADRHYGLGLDWDVGHKAR